MILKFFIIILVLLFLYLNYLSKKFYNPYKLVMIFGKKGSGKNTLLTKLSLKYNKLGYKVFSDSEIFNTYKLDPNWLTRYDFPSNSVIMIEEAGIVWDNRNYKNFSSDLRDFFKLQRHHHVIVFLCSQSFDIDKKLRDLTDEMYLTTCIGGFFSIAKRINKKITIHNGTDDNSGESFLTESYNFDFPWTYIYTYIPRYIKFFNSFEVKKKGVLVPQTKYIFNDEQFLYSIQNNKSYISYKSKDFLQNTKTKIQVFKYSFILDWFVIWFNFDFITNTI